MDRLSLAIFILFPAVFGQGRLVFNPDLLKSDNHIVAGGSRHPQAANAERGQLIFDGPGPPICPRDDGVYEDIDYCDWYWTCRNGVATQTICPDGLVFDVRKAQHSDPCDTPHVVPCGNRQQLQEPSFVSEYCPRKYGTFEHPDTTICYIYYQCVNGEHTEIECAAGLHFNGTQGSCNWPRISLRDGCIEKLKVSKDGIFTCPNEKRFDDVGQRIPHPSYPNLDDCAKFYVCLNGDIPQAASCDKGLVFNERSMLCDLPSTVPECDGWYADNPAFAHYYDDAPVSGRNDPGRVDVVG